MIAGDADFMLNSLLPARAGGLDRGRIRRGLAEPRAVATGCLECVGRVPQLRPRGLDVGQARLAVQPRLHVAHGGARLVEARPLLRNPAAPAGALVEPIKAPRAR